MVKEAPHGLTRSAQTSSQIRGQEFLVRTRKAKARASLIVNLMNTLEQRELCDKLIDFGRQGKSYAQMAASLDVSRNTLYQWRATYPQINDALTRARDYALAWWEDRGMDGMFTQGFNATLWAKQVSCRFPDDYTDKNKQEVSGSLSGLTVRFVKGTEDAG